MINIEDFDKIEMRAGTVIDVKDNKKSRNPAYVVTIDFGEEIGIKKSSAQITTLYKPEDLIGTLAFSAGLIDQNIPISAKELAAHFDWANLRKEDIYLDGTQLLGI